MVQKYIIFNTCKILKYYTLQKCLILLKTFHISQTAPSLVSFIVIPNAVKWLRIASATAQFLLSLASWRISIIKFINPSVISLFPALVSSEIMPKISKKKSLKLFFSSSISSFVYERRFSLTLFVIRTASKSSAISLGVFISSFMAS